MKRLMMKTIIDYQNDEREKVLLDVRDKQEFEKETYPGERKGSETAREAAAQTMAEVKRAMRINYFEDAELIKSQSQKYAEK